MQRRCGLVIVRVLGRLWRGCHKRHYRIQASRKSTLLAAVAVSSVTPGAACSSCSDRKAVPALMDLPLPKFAGPEDRLARLLRPGIVMTDSPASPAPARLTDPRRLLSPCLYLDALSSEESVGPGDISTVPTSFCISDDYGTHCRKMTCRRP